MVLPFPLRILQTDIKVAYQRRCDLIQLDRRNVTARTGVVAETELESFVRMSYMFES